eukprot:TRINITY_DN4838_c0_g3_i1.p2 TRINITY_DN4838_c0_g3~~TRINITY_DN4838_c0_g3_i1.p2  ORF type:complete len:239 (-),score=18.83 TRINITY_DN4838_c0_g3_i1:1447-2163(-)
MARDLESNSRQQPRAAAWSLKTIVILTVVVLVAILVIIATAVAVIIAHTGKGGRDNQQPEKAPVEYTPIEADEPIVIVIEPPKAAEPSPTPQDPSGLDPGMDAWLTAHNVRRAKHCNTKPLTWNTDLVASAQAWADNCKFEHSDRGGENLYMISGGYSGISADRVLTQFYDNEIILYDYDKPTFSMATGHFTQVVWKSTREVGCATQKCPDFALVVCHYSPNGNVLGQFDAKVAPLCN